MRVNSRLIINFPVLYREDEDSVGKKAHELGMLWKLGIPLPQGFVITAQFFKEFLALTGIDKEIKKTQKINHPALSHSVDKLFYPIRRQIMQTHIPQHMASELHMLYRKLSGSFKNRPLNVFSSSSNNKSILFSNVKGDANLILKIKTIWSKSVEEPVAIVVQESIRPEIKGKIFTDSPILDKKLNKTQMDKLIGYCSMIQKHFYFPKEIEYAVCKGKIFVTRISPFTGTATESAKLMPKNSAKKALAKGVPVNPGIVTGPVRILRNRYADVHAKSGEIIVLSCLNSSLFRKIKNAKAVVVDTILTNSLEKALYRRAFHIPTIEGTKNATKLFRNGNIVTVNGVSGEIYSGGLIY